MSPTAPNSGYVTLSALVFALWFCGCLIYMSPTAPNSGYVTLSALVLVVILWMFDMSPTAANSGYVTSSSPSLPWFCESLM